MEKPVPPTTRLEHPVYPVNPGPVPVPERKQLDFSTTHFKDCCTVREMFEDLLVTLDDVPDCELKTELLGCLADQKLMSTMSKVVIDIDEYDASVALQISVPNPYYEASIAKRDAWNEAMERYEAKKQQYTCQKREWSENNMLWNKCEAELREYEAYVYSRSPEREQELEKQIESLQHKLDMIRANRNA